MIQCKSKRRVACLHSERIEASVYPQLAFGAFLGWQIRLGKGQDLKWWKKKSSFHSELLAVSFWWTFQTSQETTPVSMGFTSATLHPLLSIGAFLFFLVGGVLIGRDKAGWNRHSHVRESSHMIQFSSNALGQVTFAGCFGALGVSQIATHREGSCSFSFLPTGQLNQHVSCRV